MALPKRKGFFRNRLLLLSCFFLGGCFVFYRWWTLSFDSREWLLLLGLNVVLLLAGVYLIGQWYRQDREQGTTVKGAEGEQQQGQDVYDRLEKYVGDRKGTRGEEGK